MKKIKINVAILIATFLTTSAFAAAPVSDITMSGINVQSNKQVESQLAQLTRLLETRNKMQARLQSQLDELTLEVRQMKGSIELSNHKIEQVENRQRNLYQLIDELNKPTAAPIVTDTTVDTSNAIDKVAYQKALNLVLVNKDYDQAITAFEAFAIDYPQSKYLANSYYWLGQLLNKQKSFKDARVAFLKVVEQYPDSNKRADALYKIGFIDEYLGNTESSKVFYAKAIDEYPDSSAADLAKKRLDNL